VSAIPELESHCGSWIVTNMNTGAVVELFDRRDVEVVTKYPHFLIETALQYLGRINTKIRHAQA